MGKGTSTSEQKTDQSSTTAPWLDAQPALKGILGQLTGQLGNTGITGAESGALDALKANAGNAGQFLPQIQGLLKDMFAGGGATAGLDDYKRRLAGTADGTQIGGNSGLRPYLDTISNDVQNRVNGMFAGAGRDFSGANQMALARGIAEGTAPVIASQYNTDVGNMRSAADALYGAERGAAQQGIANRQAGAQMAPTVFDTQNAGQKAILEAEALRRGIPTQALGLLAQIGIPIAGLGSQSTGTATTTGSKTMSGMEQLMMGTQAFKNVFGGATDALKLLSDRRAKEDIKQIGEMYDGTPIYRFRYKGDPRMVVGLMADDVEKYAPQSIGDYNGYKTVDYELATNRAVGVR